MRILVACAFLAVSCAPTKAERPSRDAGVEPGEADGGPADAGATAGSDHDGGQRARARWPMLPANSWARFEARNPGNIWESGAAFDARTETLVQVGGHVLRGYPQSSYTFRFHPRDGGFSLSTAPVRPQRMCLVDTVWISSLSRVLLSQGSLEHGSLSKGALSSDGTAIDWTYRRPPPPGPWLYDPRADTWEDARLVSTTMGSRFHSSLAYDEGSDRVGYLLADELTLYLPRLNRVQRRALPDGLKGRRSYGIAADPDARRFYVFGGSTQTPLPFWTTSSDLTESHEAQVKNDLWEYDIPTDRWTLLAPSSLAPKGMPTADFLRVPLLFHPQTRSLFTIQVPVSRYIDGGASAWPPAALWRFDLDAREWSPHLAGEGPRFPGLLRLGPEDRLLLLGGGQDGDAQRPALSQEVWWIRPTLDRPTHPSPPALELVRVTATSVELAFEPDSAIDVFRAPAGEVMGPELLVASAVTSGRFVDEMSTEAFAWRVRRVGERRFSPPVFNQPTRPEGVVADVTGPRAVTVRAKAMVESSVVGFHMHRARGFGAPERLTTTPVPLPFTDTTVDLTDGVLRRYWVTAVSLPGLESGPSPQAFTAPDSPWWFDAQVVDAGVVDLSWALRPGAPPSAVEVFFNDTHVNTLGQPAMVIDGWVANWRRAAIVPAGESALRFVVPDASRAMPHTYFFLRAVNVLGQPGFITDIVSPTDTRFVSATARTSGQWPRR